MFYNMDQVKSANKANGYYFFSPDTMRFFASRASEHLDYNTQCFVTSEKRCFEDYTRVYAVRQVGPNGNIKTLAKDFSSSRAAWSYIKKQVPPFQVKEETTAA
jgi:hypothetical protein